MEFSSVGKGYKTGIIMQ